MVLGCLVLLVVCAALTDATTVCSSSLHGVCISSASSCPTGHHLSYSYCSFLHFCCYPPSGSSGTSNTHTTHRPSVTATPSHGTSGSHTGTCGVASVNEHHRIVGGTQATLGEYPWQVSLRYHGQHLCGGTLIDNQWVVTAAHCFKGTVRQYWTVGIGITDIGRSLSGSHVRQVSHIYKHAQYNEHTNLNDITLLKLSSPVDLSGSNVRSACLPDSNENFETMVCTVTGWGATHSDGGAVRYMREVDIPIMTNSMCAYYLGQRQVHTSNICAGYTQGGKDSCQGDSGGPLVCRKNGVWKLAGVVSWGYGCAQRHSPGVYTRVSSFLSWIDSVKSSH